MKKKGKIPAGWTKEMYEKFERCVKDVKKKNKENGTDYNPYAVCHASLKYDLPEPYDIHFNALDVVLRLVPQIDNLVEIAVYIDDETFKKIKEKLDEMGIHYEMVDQGYIARRGRKEKATNIFIIES